MTKTILLTLVSLATICHASYGANNPSEKFPEANHFFLQAQEVLMPW